MNYPLIEFQGKKYLLVNQASIVTEEEYRLGLGSYAILLHDNRILRFGKQIGHKDDIKWLGEREIILSPTELIEALMFQLATPIARNEKDEATLKKYRLAKNN